MGWQMKSLSKPENWKTCIPRACKDGVSIKRLIILKQSWWVERIDWEVKKVSEWAMEIALRENSRLEDFLGRCLILWWTVVMDRGKILQKWMEKEKNEKVEDQERAMDNKYNTM